MIAFRFLFFVAAVAVLSFNNFSPPLYARGTIDRTLARLNEDIITESDLADAYADEQGHFKNPYSSSVMDRLTTETVRNLFDNILLKQYAKKLGVTIPKDDINMQVDDMVAEIRAKFTSETEFRAALNQDGLSVEALQEELEKKAKDDFLIYSAINSRFAVTSKDVEKFESEAGGDRQSFLSLKLRRIGIPITKEKPRSQAFAELQAIVSKGISAGLTFEEIVRNSSQIPGSDQDGGDLGYVSMDKLSENVRAAVKELSPGQASKPVVAGEYANIFYVEGRRGSKSHLTRKLFEENRAALLNEQRRRTTLAVFDEKFMEKLPAEYKSLLKSSNITERRKTVTSSAQILLPPTSNQDQSTPASFPSAGQSAAPYSVPAYQNPTPTPYPARRTGGPFGLFRKRQE